nr:MAG: hypothetical protein [Bacteriophage sp.]
MGRSALLLLYVGTYWGFSIMLMLYILGFVILFAIVAGIALNAYIINKFPKDDEDEHH